MTTENNPQFLNPTGELTDLGSNPTQGIALLLGQYINSTGLKQLLSSSLEPLDELQTATLAVHYDRWIDNATGVQLDVLGAIVGEERNGKLDEDFRRGIRSRILVNYSNGKNEELVEISQVHEPNLETYRISEYISNAQILWLLGTLLDNPGEVAGRLFDASAAGVNTHIIWSPSGAVSSSLVFSDGTASPFPILSSSLSGFGDAVSGSYGGFFTSVIPKVY